MKKILSFLALFSIGLQGFCDDICDDGCYAAMEPMESPPIYVQDVPAYSYRMRCEEKEVPVRKLCSRPVQRYYEVQRVRYVPQCYKETICRTEIEYYYVESVDTRQNWVCDTNCEYSPLYYRSAPCVGEDKMTPCDAPRPKRYPKPFGGKECQ
jgi:hypothetical protein